jgi:hypothetical protein
MLSKNVISTICIRNSDGQVLARNNWVIAFFLPNPFGSIARAAQSVFDLWRTIVPNESLTFAMVGASADEAKAVGAKTLAQCRAMLDPAKAERREITAFDIFGPQPENPDHMFSIVGNREKGTGFLADEVGLVEIWCPTEFMAPLGVADFACRIGGLVPYLSGYAAPAITYGPVGDAYAAGRVIKGLALRHPGYDVASNDDIHLDLGELSVGARWVTFLGPRLVERCGGNDALAKALPGVTVASVGHGVMLRAGDEPEIGDVNRRHGTPLLRLVARAIEPVTKFGNRALQPLLGDDPDALDRWERRFLN